jgi:hypothetical protein
VVLIGHNRDIAWGITTDAEIECDGSTATLMQDGQTLRVRILSPEGAVFSVESAEQDPPEKANEGVKRLMIHLSDQRETARIAVLFSPVWPNDEVESLSVCPLADW